MTNELKQRSGRRSPAAPGTGRPGRFAAAAAKLLCWGALSCGASQAAAVPADPPAATAAAQAGPSPLKRASFGQQHASEPVRQLARWVVDSDDNRGMPFVIVDKVEATVFVFAAGGRLSGAAAALLGAAQGDDAVPGIGQRALSSIEPGERTTPAGRFVASLGRNAHGHLILWVDYDNAISLHPVVAGTRAERRAKRLGTPSPLDNRISYGCINVPPRFFQSVVSPAFKKSSGVVYVLPETRPARAVFGSYDVDERAAALALPGGAPAAP